MPENKSFSPESVEVKFAPANFDIADLTSEMWQIAEPIPITRYWSGEEAPPARHAEVRLAWTPDFLYVRFEAAQGEPLVVNPMPQVAHKTQSLWERDVCELFIAPPESAPTQYLEFEVAPTGEWLDLAIEQTPTARHTDWEIQTGLLAAADIRTDRVFMAFRVSWAGLRPSHPHPPRIGEVWRGNLLRCVGRDTETSGRGYLAWQPTFTSTPNFHVPAAFGDFIFTA